MTSGKSALEGVKVIEFAGIGPTPFCGMLLADFGADVIRIDRPGGGAAPFGIDQGDKVLGRGKRSIALDLKSDDGRETAIALAERANIVIEGFRPGVMERLGLGPEILFAANPRLIYGRMTGWGQDGPLHDVAGHDINYIAITGALHAIGGTDRPVPPLNLVGDFGGGALYLAFGLLSALRYAEQTGEGQVIDCAIVDGTLSLLAMMHGMMAANVWHDQREANLLDGAAPFYGTYRCADGNWISVGSIEPQFYTELCNRLRVCDQLFDSHANVSVWPAQRAALEAAFATHPLNHWVALFEGTDACVAPVLSLREAVDNAHLNARGSFVEFDGVIQPAPAPRLLSTPGRIARPAPPTGQDETSILRDWLMA